jgi:2-polyprenyl-6-methoxyphenol hydroxylase-like FAD-dependent oxidoreductase
LLTIGQEADAMKILVSGAGIAGCTLAWWLGRGGHQVTVVERSAGQRSSGAPIDVEGPALGVVEQMGIRPRLRESATHVDGMTFIGANGRPAVRVDTTALRRSSGRGDIELPRGDLAAILEEASRAHALFVSGDHVTGIRQDSAGVDVSFERRQAERFELVIGADGLHSGVRRLAFGPESRFVEHQGLYVATLPLPDGEEGRDVVMFNAPGRSLTIHPSRGRAMAAFIFWAPQGEFDPRDDAQHRRLLEQTYASDGWRVPELLQAMRATRELYFDSVSRVRLPSWSNGRVVLAGDAASCVSLFGGGSSLAIAGAHCLAGALAESPADLVGALERYEQRQRRLAEPRTKGMSRVALLLVPRSQLTITARNALLHLWPLVAAVNHLTHRSPSTAPAAS